MRVKELMSSQPATCTSSTPLPEVARAMKEQDCGMIPVTDRSGAPIGVVTDRDIVCRTVAERRNPIDLTAGDVMTKSCVTIGPEASLEECQRLLEEHQLRRVLVVDDGGSCCGVVAQADIALHGPAEGTAEVVREVSRPS